MTMSPFSCKRIALSSSFIHQGNTVACLNTRAPQHSADISVVPILKVGKAEAQQLTQVCGKVWSSTQDSWPWTQCLNPEDHPQGHRRKAYLWLAVWGKVWTHAPITLGSQRRWLGIPIGISVSWWPPIIYEGKENSDHRGFPPATGQAKGRDFLPFFFFLFFQATRNTSKKATEATT